MRLNLDNPVLDYMNTAVHFIALNLIFILCCLPVITAGPSIAALYQVTMREVRKEHGYIIRTYFRHFKEMFLQGASTFLFFALLLFVLVYGMAFWFSMGGTVGSLAFMITLILTAFCACAMIYVFPLMARFKNSWGRTIKNAFLMTLSHPGYSALLLILHIFVVSLLYLFPGMKIFMLVIGYSFTAYVNSLLLARLFHRYEETGKELQEE